MFVGADEELAVGGGDGGHGGFTEGVGGEGLEFWGGAQDEGVAGLVNDVDAVASQNHGGPGFAFGAWNFEAFFENDFPGFQIVAFDDWRFVENINMAIVDDAGADALFGAGMLPEAMGFGDVPCPAGFDGNGGAAEAAHSDNGSVFVQRRSVDE